MLISLAVIFLVGLFMADIFNLLKLPKIIGMLLTGILTGPFVLDLIDPSVLGISSELRRIALIIILIKAGLSLNLSDLKKVGRPAVMMSFVPACFEITGYIIFAPLLLGLTRSESAVMGAVLSAVSPAVVVPRMVNLIEEKTGTKKGIPQMILAGASCNYAVCFVHTYDRRRFTEKIYIRFGTACRRCNGLHGKNKGTFGGTFPKVRQTVDTVRNNIIRSCRYGG